MMFPNSGNFCAADGFLGISGTEERTKGPPVGVGEGCVFLRSGNLVCSTICGKLCGNVAGGDIGCIGGRTGGGDTGRGRGVGATAAGGAAGCTDGDSIGWSGFGAMADGSVCMEGTSASSIADGCGITIDAGTISASSFVMCAGVTGLGITVGFIALGMGDGRVAPGVVSFPGRSVKRIDLSAS